MTAKKSKKRSSRTRSSVKRQKHALLVLGMHRSGTSAMAGVLRLLGAAVPRNLMATHETNPVGFFESAELMEIHDELLQSAGLAWDDIGPLSTYWYHSPAAEHFQQRLLAFLQEDFADAPLFVIKDPRACRFAPLWLSALAEFQAEPHAVIIVRNPLEVAASLKIRDGFVPGKSYLLWLRHILDAERNTRGVSRSFVTYDRFLANWRRVAEILSEDLRIKWPRTSHRAAVEIDQFLVAKHRHHVFDAGELNARPEVVDWVKRAYETVAAMAEGGESKAALRSLDDIASALAQADLAFGPVVTAQKLALEDLGAGEERLSGERDAARADIAERDGRIEALSGELMALQEAVAERDAARADIAERDGRIEALSGELMALQEAVAERDGQVAAIMNSTSWKISAPVRAVGGIIRRFKNALPSGVLLVKAKSGNASISLPENFHGCLEAPHFGSFCEGAVLVAGWVFCRGAEIAAVGVTVGNARPLQIAHGGERVDVEQAFPDEPGTLRSGFCDYVRIPATEQKTTRILVSVLLKDGRCVDCFSSFVKNKALVVLHNQKAPIIPFIKSVMQKAWLAVRHRRLPMSITAWRIALYRHYAAHQAFYADLQRRQRDSGADHDWQRQTPYDRWLEINALTPRLRHLMAQDAAKIAENGPKISIVVPLHNTPSVFLHELIGSVTSQIYANWELCLADDRSSVPHVKEIVTTYQKTDARINAIFRTKHGHISQVTNSALSLVTGEYVALLDHDDILPPDALLHVAECILANPGVDWIYTDEDKVDELGRRFDPQFKAEWSPEMAITHNYTHHLTVIRTALVDQAGEMRPGFEGAQDLDLFLRVAEATSFDKVRHIPQICYHWRAHRDSTASRGDQKQYILDAAKKAIEEALARRNLAARVELPTLAKTHSMCLYQLRWAKDILADNPVTIVIPTRDRVNLLRKCVKSLQRTVDDQHVKLVIIDDKSIEPDTLAYFAELKERRIFGCKVVRNSHPHKGFNYSRLMNIAMDHVDTENLLHLNNDIFATTPGWLEDMVGWLSVDGVGIVGAKLHYPDGRIQHAGVVARGADALPCHLFEGQQAHDVGYLALPHVARNVSAVTGACLLTTKSLYHALGGFDEERFSVEFNDIDFCLRAIARGERVVISPQATLTHVTGASRSGISFNPQTHLNYVRQYADFPERYFNRNLAPNSSAMAVNPTYFNHVNRVGPLKVLFISHELSLGGAPIVLSEYAEYFQSAGKYHVEVLSPQDGPLHDRYRDKGILVHLDGGRILSPHKSLEDIRADLLVLGQRLDLPSFDLIVCNTVTTFWGIELAQLFSLPSIWHIHESTTVRDFGKSMSVAEQAILTAAFTHATRVVFQCEATRRLYHQHDTFGRFRTIPGGLPLDRIAAYRASHSKHALRTKFGVNQDHTVVTLIGTTCLRKGQHIFVEAINQIQRDYGSKLENVSFIMVGARPDPYLDSLKKRIADFRLKNVYIFNETTEIYDFFQLSDVFVCASFEESFPRVILLAMAFELRIVSTNVFGIAEIIKDGHNGRLIEPGDANAMAAILMECLQHDKAYERLAKVAVSTVSRLFDNQWLLPRHLDLTKEAVVDDFHHG